MKDNKNTCEDCGSTNTWTSEDGYNTVIICDDCHHEEHDPVISSTIIFKNLLDTIPSL